MSNTGNLEVVMANTKAWISSISDRCSVSSVYAVAEDVSQTTLSNGIILSITAVNKTSKFIVNLVYEDQLKSIIVNWTDFTTGESFDTERFKNYLNSKLLLPPATSQKESGNEKRERDASNIKAALFAEIPQPAMPSAPSTTSGPVPASGEQPPKFDDEYQMLGSQGLRGGGSGGPPTSIGERDLNPPGIPKDPAMKPYIDPAGQGSEGGMHPTSNHPLFTGRGGPGRPTPPFGLPGARFDDPMLGNGEDDMDMIGSGLPGNLKRPGRGGLGDNSFGPFSGRGPGSSNGFGGPSFGDGSGGFM